MIFDMLTFLGYVNDSEVTKLLCRFIAGKPLEGDRPKFNRKRAMTRPGSLSTLHRISSVAKMASMLPEDLLAMLAGVHDVSDRAIDERRRNSRE
jgi:hypothetical protein